MIWVGGGIIVHALEAYGVHFFGQAINSAAEAAVRALPSVAGAVKWTVMAFLSGIVGLAIGTGVDPSNRICRRTRMETVEGYFGRAPRMSLRLQPVGFQPNSQIRARGYLHAGDENNRRRLRFRKYVSRERSAWISSKDIWAFLLLAVIALRTGKAEG
jgi:hypothetical protein